MTDAARQICFVDMPLGWVTEPRSGVQIDFDQVFEAGVAPAIREAGLLPVRRDREESEGIFHRAAFARLLLAEFVIADMTMGDPAVFYQLGVRHAVRPRTTIPIFATVGAPSFDLSLVRAAPYELRDGRLEGDAAAALIATIEGRIAEALKGTAPKDSPLFRMFPEFEGVAMSHELTDVFRDRVRYSAELRERLRGARELQPSSIAAAAIVEIEASLGRLSGVEPGVLIDILLSYRAVGSWDDMIRFHDLMPGEAQTVSIARQQLALALNRRNREGDRERAIGTLERLLREEGDSAETLGILGRIYKDRHAEVETGAGDEEGGGDADESWMEDAVETWKREMGGSAKTLDRLREVLRIGADRAREESLLGAFADNARRTARRARGDGAQAATEWLDRSIDAYRRGYEADPLDFYPGINAITLLLRKGDEAALAEVDRLTPLVTFAAVRRGGVESRDYWTVATVLEFACAGRDPDLAERALARAATLADEAWKLRTTAANLRLIAAIRLGEPGADRVEAAAAKLETKADELAGD